VFAHELQNGQQSPVILLAFEGSPRR